jgi:acetyl esterase/lipase
MTSLILASCFLAAAFRGAGPALVCCGGEEVFILPVNVESPGVDDRLWRWRATDSREIPADARPWFRTTDECKPLPDSILITSSSGGVALIRRADKRCRFYAFARNAHSACVAPGDRIAVASSFGGDELLLYAVGEAAGPAEPIARLPLVGAHGVLWDSQRERLWALGSDELVLVKIEQSGDVRLIAEERWKLPTEGGHDLSPTRDENRLYVTTNRHVYQFAKAKGEFSLDPALGDQARVKSVAAHPAAGEVVYHQATEEHWWSDVIRFAGDRDDIRLPGERLYKVRWELPEAENAQPQRIALWSGEAAPGEAAITVHRPAEGNGAAVIICPGGGYGGLVTGPEGHGIARWLNQHGIMGIVLEYELPKGRPQVPLRDVQRAIRMARANAQKWKLDPKRIGVMGLSAGGHLASSAGTHFDGGDPDAKDPIERVSCRPDFMILIYPVITMGEAAHAGSKRNLLGEAPTAELVRAFSNETQVTKETPPAFLAHARDDKVVSPDNSRSFHEALRAHNIASEYLELPSGGHGLNGYRGPMWEAWQAASLRWLAVQGFIPRIVANAEK